MPPDGTRLRLPRVLVPALKRNVLTRARSVNQTGGWSVIQDNGHYLGSMMSHWDFGRSPDEHHDAPRPAGPSRAAYPPDLESGLDHDDWPAQERPTSS